jgi:Tol biopolymer transport system component/DNA-binding winged helix-turn-helix (wHTH) protein
VPGNQTNGVIGFGVFQVDLRTGELRRNGSKVRLQDQPFQVLAVLLEKPGEVVTREELRARLWPTDTFVDFDHGLNAAIKRLRDALGDSAENPRFVETLARRGYRFVAPVHCVTNGAAEASASNLSKQQIGQRWRIGLAVAGVLAMGTGAGWVAARHFNPRVEIREQRLTANGPDDPVLKALISADGKYLAFADRSGMFLRVISTGETHSIALPNGFRAKLASWFPDGSHLLVTAWTGSGQAPSLWSISVLGGSPRKLVDNADARSVSPDRSQIAFVKGDMSRQEIWVMSGDGERLRKIVGEPGEYYGPVAWSPGGSHLAFVRYIYKAGFHSGDISVWICNLANGETRSILSDARLGESLAWTSDGRLVYSLNEVFPNPVNSQEADSNLWAVSMDARTGRPMGEARQLTSGPDNKTDLSLSADGKHLTFLRWNGQAHVYVSEIDGESRRLNPPQRLNLDEGRNYPFTWTPDSESVIFTSDRDGRSHLFKQRSDQPVPDLLVGGTDTVTGARLNPDGSEVLYVVRPESGEGLRMMRMPLAGGTPQLVLQADGVDNFQCARLPSTLCIFGKSAGEVVHLYTFDPVSGKHSEFMKAELGRKYNWSLSPDGSTLALARYRQTQIELVSMRGGARRTLKVQSWPGVASLDWAADSQSLWASSLASDGMQALLNIDLHGRIRGRFSGIGKRM